MAAMSAIVFVLVAMSALRAIWEPAEPAKAQKVRGYFKQAEMELSQNARDRSPRRRCGVKAMLKSWAKGESSAVGIWRPCYAIVTEDGTNAGLGMSRLAGLASASSGSEKTARRN